jgi:LysR family malonate utilization transcriptional regulator
MGYSLLPGRVAGFSARVDLLPLDARYASHQTITLLLALAAECCMYGARRLELPG